MKADIVLDCYGLLCPMPIIKIARKIKEVPVGQVLEVISTDEGIGSDLPAWCNSNGQEFLGIESEGNTYRGYIKKVKD